MNFQIELTNYCNLKCVECPHRLMKRDKHYMYDEVFDRILDYIKYIAPKTIIFHKDGEPLLHPKLFDYMERVDNVYNTKFDIYTNGLLLDPSFVHRLGRLSGVVSILLSYHFYNFRGERIQYEEVDKRLMLMLEHCPANVSFILATHVTDFANEDELNLWKDQWEGVMQKHKALKAVHVNPHINPWTGLIKQKNAITFPACPYADGEHMFFGVTGNVIACCMDLEEEIVFGNVMIDSFDEIMTRRKDFYKKLNEKSELRDVCLRCMA